MNKGHTEIIYTIGSSLKSQILSKNKTKKQNKAVKLLLIPHPAIKVPKGPWQSLQFLLTLTHYNPLPCLEISLT